MNLLSEPQLVPYLMRDSHIAHIREAHIEKLCDGLCFYDSMWFKLVYGSSMLHKK